MDSLEALRTFLPADRPAGVIVDLVGNGTSWTAGTTFTLSGVSGCSILTKIVHSGTSARLVVASGSATGTLTISDGTESTTIPVQQSPITRRRWFAGLA